MTKPATAAGAATTRRRRPTVKQQKFAIAYVDAEGANGNGVAAARAAGYRGDGKQLAVQASNNLRNPNVQQVITAMLDGMLEHGVLRFREAVDATKTRSMVAKGGDIVCTPPEPDHSVRLRAVELMFDLHQRCGAASANHFSDADEGPTPEEAIEAAKECLAVLAPHLLAEVATDVGRKEHKEEESEPVHSNDDVDVVQGNASEER